MRTVYARRPGLRPLGAAPITGRGLARRLAVVVLIAGIVVMHTLGLGHSPVAAGHSGMAVLTETVPQPIAATMPETKVASSSPAAHAAAGTAAVEVDWSGHGMAAMCLAVLPLLVLAIARLLGWGVRSLAHDVRQQQGSGFAPSNRAPPGLARPSLLKLCILRT